MSSTNKAFERYLGKPEDDYIRSIYKDTGKLIKIDELRVGKS